uniref:Uncharacterized protein n=1 Tax=Kwoniella bestiolae CBS 10118 TaxID=1296100 RepID=A0A1B9GAJ9_9TREE|nr:hypothetical protein I302_02899 [Kwoniella bestiolae CBS 10118]OCF28048.1 hypothetical protein I302_02899 [Kwoniella bestiolae CBS 10118]
MSPLLIILHYTSPTSTIIDFALSCTQADKSTNIPNDGTNISVRDPSIPSDKASTPTAGLPLRTKAPNTREEVANTKDSARLAEIEREITILWEELSQQADRACSAPKRHPALTGEAT